MAVHEKAKKEDAGLAAVVEAKIKAEMVQKKAEAQAAPPPGRSFPYETETV